VTKPLAGCTLKDATLTLKQHEQTQYHKLSTIQSTEFFARYNDPTKDVDHLMRTADEEQQCENRRILISIVKCVLFLGKNNLPFRGDDDNGLPNSENRSQGTFKSIIQFRSDAGDFVLANHIKNCAKNATYLSATIQNELIISSGTFIRAKLLRELIENEKNFAIIADETSDVAGIEQLSITIRYVSVEPKVEIKEIFVGFCPLTGLTASDVAKALIEFIQSIGLKWENIRGNDPSTNFRQFSSFRQELKICLIKYCWIFCF
jgi:hypothetical protein